MLRPQRIHKSRSPSLATRQVSTTFVLNTPKSPRSPRRLRLGQDAPPPPPPSSLGPPLVPPPASSPSPPSQTSINSSSSSTSQPISSSSNARDSFAGGTAGTRAFVASVGSTTEDPTVRVQTTSLKNETSKAIATSKLSVDTPISLTAISPFANAITTSQPPSTIPPKETSTATVAGTVSITSGHSASSKSHSSSTPIIIGVLVGIGAVCIILAIAMGSRIRRRRRTSRDFPKTEEMEGPSEPIRIVWEHSSENTSPESFRTETNTIVAEPSSEPKPGPDESGTANIAPRIPPIPTLSDGRLSIIESLTHVWDETSPETLAPPPEKNNSGQPRHRTSNSIGRRMLGMFGKDRRSGNTSISNVTENSADLAPPIEHMPRRLPSTGTISSTYTAMAPPPYYS